jgi:type I restriction enzyme R subunit
MIRDLYDRLLAEKPQLAPLHVWRAYEQLGKTKGSPRNELSAMVALIRNICGIDQELAPFDKTVDRNFQNWVFQKQAGNAPKFTEEQMAWLRMIKDYIATSFHIEREDFDLSPFNANGGLDRYYRLFKEDYEKILDELNEALVA